MMHFIAGGMSAAQRRHARVVMMLSEHVSPGKAQEIARMGEGVERRVARNRQMSNAQRIQAYRDAEFV